MTLKLRLILLALAVSLCYANTARNSFMWDDDAYITANERITSLKNVPALFVPVKGEPYRPLRLVTFAVERALYGLNPAMYHVDNVLIHLLNVLLLFALLRLIFRDDDLAFWSALVFAVHPAWNEAVVWVKNRSMLMAGTFMLSGLYFYARRRTFPALLAFMLGLLSKEIVVAFPAVVTAYAYLFDKDRDKSDLAPFWAIGLAWTGFLFYFYGGQAGAYAPGAAFFFSLKIMLRFLLILLFPFRLNAEREVGFPETIFDAEVIISFVLTVLAAVWLYKDRFRNKALSFLLLWLVFNLFPTANPGVVAGRPLAEHRLYIVGAGFSVLLVMALGKRKGLLYLLLPVLFMTSFRRNADWRDGHAFWTSTAHAAPYSPRAYTNLALAEKSLGNTARAEEYFGKAVELDAGYTAAIRGLAGLLAEKGRLAEAEKMLTGAAERYPSDLGVHTDLSDIYARQRRGKEAVETILKAVSLVEVDEGAVDDYLTVGLQAFRLGLMRAAETSFRKVSEARPWSAFVLSNLASVYHAEKRYAEAEKYFRSAIEKDPSNPAYHYNLGNLYYNIGAKEKAASSYRIATTLEENYADAWYNLGVLHKERGEFEEAERCFNRARRIELLPLAL